MTSGFFYFFFFFWLKRFLHSTFFLFVCLFEVFFNQTMLQRFPAVRSGSIQIHSVLRIGFGQYFAELYVVGLLPHADNIQMPMQLNRCEKYICGIEVAQTSCSLIRYLQILLLHLMLYSITKELQNVVACSYNGTNAHGTDDKCWLKWVNGLDSEGLHCISVWGVQ